MSGGRETSRFARVSLHGEELGVISLSSWHTFKTREPGLYYRRQYRSVIFVTRWVLLVGGRWAGNVLDGTAGT